MLYSPGFSFNCISTDIYFRLKHHFLDLWQAIHFSKANEYLETTQCHFIKHLCTKFNCHILWQIAVIQSSRCRICFVTWHFSIELLWTGEYSDRNQKYVPGCKHCTLTGFLMGWFTLHTCIRFCPKGLFRQHTSCAFENCIKKVYTAFSTLSYVHFLNAVPELLKQMHAGAFK